MNHGFLLMIRKLSANQCIGRAPVHQEWRKLEWPNQNSKQWWLCFSTSVGFCVRKLGTWRSNCESAILPWGPNYSPWMSEKKATWIVEEQVMDSSSGQRPGPYCIVCQDVFGQAWDPCVGTSTLFTGPCPMWLFSVPQGEIRNERNEIWGSWSCERQTDGDHKHAFRKWLPTLLWPMENSHGAV